MHIAGMQAPAGKERERRVLEVVQQHPDGVNRDTIAKEVGVSVRALGDHLRRLRGMGKIERVQVGENMVVFKPKRR